MKRDPREEMTIRMERVATSELQPVSKSARSFIERSGVARIFLKTIGVFGVSLVMAGMDLSMITYFDHVLTYSKTES